MKKNLIAIAFASMGLVCAGAFAQGDQTNPQQSQPDQSSSLPSPQSELSLDSDSVQLVQLALADQGYDPGAIDGQLSSQTQDALKQAQRANGLGETGQINLDTLVALGLIDPNKSGQTTGGPNGSPESDGPYRS